MTQEQKETNFENEWVKYFAFRSNTATVSFKHLARHFYEFGLNVRRSDQLTEKDIATIYSLMIEALYEQRSGSPSFDGKDIFEEVLKWFNAQKEK